MGADDCVLRESPNPGEEVAGDSVVQPGKVFCRTLAISSNEGFNKVETIEGKVIWREARGHLAETLSKDVYDRWIAVIEFKKLEENTLVLSVANDFYQTWLIENYLGLIRDAVATAAARELDIAFEVDRAASPSTPARGAGREESEPAAPMPSRRRYPKPSLNQKYTFDRFVVGPSNNFAHAASLAVAQSPARAYNPLFIYGGAGLGKTHLMQAIGHHVLHRRA